eukprot:1058966-Pyramimonas_sp.AAC.1
MQSDATKPVDNKGLLKFQKANPYLLNEDGFYITKPGDEDDDSDEKQEGSANLDSDLAKTLGIKKITQQPKQ